MLSWKAIILDILLATFDFQFLIAFFFDYFDLILLVLLQAVVILVIVFLLFAAYDKASLRQKFLELFLRNV